MGRATPRQPPDAPSTHPTPGSARARSRAPRRSSKARGTWWGRRGVLESAVRRDGSAASLLALGDLLLRYGKTDLAVRSLQKVPPSAGERRRALSLLVRAFEVLGLPRARVESEAELTALGGPTPTEDQAAPDHAPRSLEPGHGSRAPLRPLRHPSRGRIVGVGARPGMRGRGPRRARRGEDLRRLRRARRRARRPRPLRTRSARPRTTRPPERRPPPRVRPRGPGHRAGMDERRHPGDAHRPRGPHARARHRDLLRGPHRPRRRPPPRRAAPRREAGERALRRRRGHAPRRLRRGPPRRPLDDRHGRHHRDARVHEPRAAGGETGDGGERRLRRRRDAPRDAHRRSATRRRATASNARSARSGAHRDLDSASRRGRPHA